MQKILHKVKDLLEENSISDSEPSLAPQMKYWIDHVKDDSDSLIEHHEEYLRRANLLWKKVN